MNMNKINNNINNEKKIIDIINNDKILYNTFKIHYNNKKRSCPKCISFLLFINSFLIIS